MKLARWIAPALVLALASGAAFAQKAGTTHKKESADRTARKGRTMSRGDSAPKVGQIAPTFKLKSLDGKQEFDLASFKGKKPVLLFFGSYT